MKLTKVIASTLVAVLVLAFSPIGASAEWKQDSTGWWYTEYNSYSKGWDIIGGKWYYFGQDGYMTTSTKTIDGDTYNFNEDGSLNTKKQDSNKIITSDALKQVITDSDSLYNPPARSREELYQDMFVSQLLPDIQKSIDDYYKNFLTEEPIVTPDYVQVLNTERLMGYRSFSFRLKLKVSSYIGPHLNIGDDYITIKIEGGDKVTIEKFEHIKSYFADLPSNRQNIIIKKLN